MKAFLIGYSVKVQRLSIGKRGLSHHAVSSPKICFILKFTFFMYSYQITPKAKYRPSQIGILFCRTIGKITSEDRITPHLSAWLSCRDDCHEFGLFGGLGGVEKLLIRPINLSPRNNFFYLLFYNLITKVD
jgi:hypothetical protein